jgi:hypothetical protein
MTLRLVDFTANFSEGKPSCQLGKNMHWNSLRCVTIIKLTAHNSSVNEPSGRERIGSCATTRSWRPFSWAAETRNDILSCNLDPTDNI